MKIAITYPPLGGPGVPMLTQNRQFQWFTHPSYLFPIVPAQAATLLAHDGHDVLWDDSVAQGLSAAEHWARLEREAPEWVVCETKTPVVKRHWAWIREAKRRMPTTRFVLLGDHITALPEESFRESPIDFAIVGGNYDLTLRDLMRAIEKGTELPTNVYGRDGDAIVHTPVAIVPVNLDELPFIDRRLTEGFRYSEKWWKRKPFFRVMAGRDCHWGVCTFCSWTTLYPADSFSARSPANVLDELEYLIAEHGAREIFDDTGTLPIGRWLDEFSAGMVERGLADRLLFSCNMRFDALTDATAEKMARAGFRKLKLGLESTSAETLRRLRKGTTPEQVRAGCRAAKKHGLEIHLTIMVGYPWETREDLASTFGVVEELYGEGAIEMLQSTVLIPYPGTPLYKQAVEQGWLLCDPQDYDHFGMREPILRTDGLSAEEILDWCRRFYRLSFRPEHVARRFLGIRSTEDVSYLARGAWAMAGHIRDFLGRARGSAAEPAAV